jgi:hypothetical protein
MVAGAAGGAILGGSGALAYDQYEDNQPDEDGNGGAPHAQNPQAPEEDPVQPEDSGEETYEVYDRPKRSLSILMRVMDMAKMTIVQVGMMIIRKFGLG